MLRYLTAGESHGRALLALVDGFPAGVELNVEAINAEFARRQGGYGRGGRQKIETDHVEVLSGIWRGTTLGSPIALLVPNKDFKIDEMDDLDRPRPGHGDLSGSIKYLTSVRAILERASARETTVRVAAGALAKQLLGPLGITAFAYVVQVGEMAIPPKPGTLDQQRADRDASIMYTLDKDRDGELSELIDRCKRAGDTLGGIVEIRVEGRALRPGNAHAVGQEARRPARPGGDGRAGDEGRRDRHGFRGRAAARLAGPRPDPVRSGPGSIRARSASRGRTTTPADWKPA